MPRHATATTAGVCVGGVVFAPEAPVEIAALPPRVRPFATCLADDHPRIRTIRTAGGEVADDLPVLFDSGYTWRIRGSRDCPVLEVVAGDRERTAVQGVRASSDWSEGTWWSHQEAPWIPEPLWELWMAAWLARGRGLLVHGAAVLKDQEATVLVGRSGAGKSTAAALLARRGVPVLTDDRVVVRPTRSGWIAWGTPWHGEARFGAPVGAPLARLLFLRQDPRCSRTPLDPADAAARLAACCFSCGWPREDTFSTILKYCGEIASVIPCEELAFAPDARILYATLWP